MANVCPKAGDLKDRMELQSASTTVDSHGEDDLFDEAAWSTDGQLWADLQPKSADEKTEGNQIAPEATHVATIRFRKDIQSEHRLLYRKFHTTLNGAINGTTTTVTVDDAVAVSSRNDRLILVGSELMLVTAGHGTTSLTVTRGANNTTATSHADEADVFVMGVLNIEGIVDAENRHERLDLFCKEVV